MADPTTAQIRNQTLEKYLQSGLGSFDGPQTRGQNILQGIADLSVGADNFIYGLPEKVSDYFNSPTPDYKEYLGKVQNLADARRESSLTMPSDGLGRPREIEDQINIFQALNPEAGSLSAEQINQLSRNQSEGRKSKPFPTEQAERVMSNRRGRGKVNEQLGDRENYQRSIDGPTPEEMSLMEQAREQGQGQGQGGAELKEETVQNLFSESMAEYLKEARTGAEDDLPELGDIEDYKKEFAKATGVDISGKPDTSQALMAMGLSLMQNRAGKGFNVGKILRAVGESGEKALPALEKAKTEARNNVIAAGKFALEAQSSDKTKREAAKKEMSALNQYFVVPKGDGVAGTVSSILQNKGSLETLSKGELQQLMQNPEFASKYDLLPGSMYKEIITETMKTPEAALLYDTKTPRKMELFGEGAGDLFTIETWRALPNSGVENKLVGLGDETYKALQNAARDINLAKEKFVTGMELAEGTNIFRFGVDKLDSLASTLGFNMREGITPTQQLEFILDKLQAQNAPEILGEAGKTISDADRARVAQIVGDLRAGSTADEITYKLNELFNDIIIKKERDILDALKTLDRYTSRSVAPDDGPISEEDAAELAKREKQRLAGT